MDHKILKYKHGKRVAEMYGCGEVASCRTSEPHSLGDLNVPLVPHGWAGTNPLGELT